MADYWIEAAGLLLRWLHVIAAIAWIGESFYFVALDRGLKPAKQPSSGLSGESWSVHGGGFYLKQKFLPAPPQLPDELHWSKWKSYTTWLSGFALFALMYLLSPQVYLIDPAVAAWSPTEGVLLALALPVVGWWVYDGLCRLIGPRDDLLGVLVAVLVVAVCVVATQMFAGRAAFLLAGATLATIMSANVFFVIIPGQKRMVAALQSGATPNPLDGARGKQRSVHNTYFTLPVVFAMLSTHYATAFAHPHSWAVLALFMAAGALIRQFFVLWHSGGRAWWLLVSASVILAVLFVWMAPASRPSPAHDSASQVTGVPVAAAPVASKLPTVDQPAGIQTAALGTDTTTMLGIAQRRCIACHSAQPTMMASAPKGSLFERAEQWEVQAALIHRQVVELKIMPPGNVTGLTDAERAAIDGWFRGLTNATK
ncbi:MAG: urate hydroxylase PuuD [Pseudomarimonas sp.]